MKTLQSKVNEYGKANQKLLAKLGLTITPTVTFPNREETPFLSKMAIKVVNKQGGRIDFYCNEVK